MSDMISTKKVLYLLAGMVAEIINMPPERMETHECDNERTETHGDLISRKAAIDFIDAGHLCNPNELRWSDNDVVNFLKKRPSAEPERAQFGPDCHLVWQYCKDPNDVMKAVMEKDENWEGLYSPEQIISIVYDSNHKSYVVFWIAKW